jgi:hypothetical protein
MQEYNPDFAFISSIHPLLKMLSAFLKMPTDSVSKQNSSAICRRKGVKA